MTRPVYNTIASAYSTTADSSATILMFCPISAASFFSVSTSTPGAYQAMVTAYDSTKYGISITAPIVSAALLIGQPTTINWSSQIMVGGNVDIYLYNNGGIVQTIATNVANSGAYTWTIPALTPGNDYYIKVISQIDSHINGASGAFSIKAN